MLAAGKIDEVEVIVRYIHEREQTFSVTSLRDFGCSFNICQERPGTALLLAHFFTSHRLLIFGDRKSGKQKKASIRNCQLISLSLSLSPFCGEKEREKMGGKWAEVQRFLGRETKERESLWAEFGFWHSKKVTEMKLTSDSRNFTCNLMLTYPELKL